MALTPLNIIAALWAIVVALYFVLFLYRSVVGMHEEDNLYLSDGEARFEADQREVMKQITKLEFYSRKLGIAALAMTVVLTGTWIYSIVRNLFS